MKDWILEVYHPTKSVVVNLKVQTALHWTQSWVHILTTCLLCHIGWNLMHTPINKKRLSLYSSVPQNRMNNLPVSLMPHTTYTSFALLIIIWKCVLKTQFVMILFGIGQQCHKCAQLFWLMPCDGMFSDVVDACEEGVGVAQCVGGRCKLFPQKRSWTCNWTSIWQAQSHTLTRNWTLTWIRRRMIHGTEEELIILKESYYINVCDVCVLIQK